MKPDGLNAKQTRKYLYALVLELRLYSTLLPPLAHFKLVLGNIMSSGYDMLEDMLLLKPYNDVAGNETASSRFPKLAIQKIFQNFCTKVYGGVRAWAYGMQLYKQRQHLPKCSEQ